MAENRQFALEMFEAGALEAAVDWISNNLLPNQVFDDGDLAEWALENGYVLKPEEEEVAP